jgi:hydrogenase-4 transcriptional activator
MTEDVPALTRHCVTQKSRELGIAVPPPIAPGAFDRLMSHDWPGNVRELENLVERELIRFRGGQLRFETLLPDDGVSEVESTPAGSAGISMTLDEAACLHITNTLKRTKGKIHGAGGAAELLSINPNTLRARMRSLGILQGCKKKCT